MAEIVFDCQMSDIRVGMWCDHCNLPSRCEADVFWLRTTGVTKMCTVSQCRDCGARSSVRVSE